MHSPEFNLAAVVVATIAYAVIGFIWYTPLFGKLWAKQKGFDTDVRPTGSQMAKSIVLNLFAIFLVVYMFDTVLEYTTQRAWIPDGDERTQGQAIEMAYWVWLGFFAPKELAAIAWEKSTWTLAAINGGYHLVSLAAAAAILTAWL